MPYTNPKQLLDAATALPAAVEAKLPQGAPKLSTMLLEVDGKLPTLPDFPMELPDLPAVPELPAAPAGLRRYVQAVEVTSTGSRPVGSRGKTDGSQTNSVGSRGRL